jgi:hypothetical protein
MRILQKPLASKTCSKTFAIAAGLIGALVLTTRASAASPPLASGTITAVSTGAQNTYALSLFDSSTSPSPIGSVWEGWIPGQFYMSSSPTAIVAPTGWTDHLTSGNGGFGIQFVASSAAFDVPIGGSLSGFGFTTPDAPASIFGTSAFFPVPTTTSVAYDAGLFSDSGTTFAFTPTAVPEPTTLTLMASSGLLLLRRQRRNA